MNVMMCYRIPRKGCSRFLGQQTPLTQSWVAGQTALLAQAKFRIPLESFNGSPASHTTEIYTHLVSLSTSLFYYLWLIFLLLEQNCSQ